MFRDLCTAPRSNRLSLYPTRIPRGDSVSCLFFYYFFLKTKKFKNKRKMLQYTTKDAKRKEKYHSTVFATVLDPMFSGSTLKRRWILCTLCMSSICPSRRDTRLCASTRISSASTRRTLGLNLRAACRDLDYVLVPTTLSIHIRSPPPATHSLLAVLSRKSPK